MLLLEYYNLRLLDLQIKEIVIIVSINAYTKNDAKASKFDKKYLGIAFLAAYISLYYLDKEYEPSLTLELYRKSIGLRL